MKKQVAENDGCQYLVRVDDFPSGVRPKISSYRTAAGSILAALEDRDIPYVLGVVPVQLEPEDNEFLKARKGLTVALHGLNHQQVRGPFRRVANEFTHNSVETNLELLHESHRLLGDIRPRVFIPPGNAYDLNLLRALKLAGYELCLGAFPHVWLRSLPVAVHLAYPPLYGRSRGIAAWAGAAGAGHDTLFRRWLEAARSARFRSASFIWRHTRLPGRETRLRGVRQIALHWTWEWDDVQSGRSGLEAMCDWLQSRDVVSAAELFNG